MKLTFRTWLSQGDVSFLNNATPYVDINNKPKVSIERIPILSALERAVLYILKLIKERDKVREKIKKDFENFESKKGLMSLETMTGLKRREDIRNQVQMSLNQEEKRFHAEPKDLYPKTEIISQDGTLNNLTMFSRDQRTIMQSRVQGKPLEYFKRPIMPGVDLRREAEYREKQDDTLRNINYFSFDNTSSMVSNMNYAKTEDPKYGLRGKKDYSKSTKTLRKDYSRKRFTNTARNLLNNDYSRNYGLRNGPVDRDQMAMKMMEAWQKTDNMRTGGGLIGKVDAIYESLFEKKKF